MTNKRSTGLPSTALVTTPARDDLEECGVYDRHALLPGFEQSALTGATVNLIGAGAGSEVARALAREGIGRIRIFDPDPVIEFSNLVRQFYYSEQVGWPKALALPYNLAKEATAGTKLEGYAATFEDCVLSGLDVSCDVAIVAVDSNPARSAASRYFLRRAIPTIFTAFSTNADRAYVFVQASEGQPCFICAFPDQAEDPRSFPCAGATIELPLIVAGLIAFAVGTIVMRRKRYWNYRELSLSGVTGDISSVLTTNPDCPQGCERESGAGERN